MDVSISELVGFLNLNWQAVVMLAISGVLLWLGISKKVEPVLLVPIGVGCMLSNIPLGGVAESGGFLTVLADFGIHTEIFPLLIFISVGAMIDFEPLLQRPYTIFLGPAAHLGVFGSFFHSLSAG
jgi:carboxybiotin decarboxylase